MKQLRKLSLKSARLMNDSEMKMIVGGSGSNECIGSGTCSGTCPPRFDGGTMGTVKQKCVSIPSGLTYPYNNMCTCVDAIN